MVRSETTFETAARLIRYLNGYNRHKVALGGSLVLNKMGLLNRPAKDIDITVVQGSNAEMIITFLNKIYPPSKESYSYEGDSLLMGINPLNESKIKKHIRFKYQGYDVCAFIIDEDYFNSITSFTTDSHLGEIPVVSLRIIVDAKILYTFGNGKAAAKHKNDLIELKKNFIKNHYQMKVSNYIQKELAEPLGNYFDGPAYPLKCF